MSRSDWLTCPVCGTKKFTDIRHVTCSTKCGGVLRQRHWEAEMQERFGEPVPRLLERLYISERKSITEIADFLGMKSGSGNVSRLLARYGIQTRPASEGIALSWQGNDARRRWCAENLGKQAVAHYEKGVATRAAQYRAKPTRWEKVAIEHLTALGERFECQVQFGRFIADFVLPNRMLILEIDSMHHRIPHIKERDSLRTEYLESLGYRVRRIMAGAERAVSTFRRHIDEALE